MLHTHCTKTAVGGLSLLLVLSACSSGPKTRTADNVQTRSDVAATDRRAMDDRGTYSDPADRLNTRDQVAATERPVPSDR